MRLQSSYALGMLLSVVSSGLAQDKPGVISDVHSSTTRFALQRAVQAVAERLNSPKCQRVLSDFRDASGRTMQEKLELLGETPRSYLARLPFREAIDDRCRSYARLAFTHIGRREVFVCGTQFWQEYRSNPSHVEAVLIHEMMHTLGLGENPPSSEEITAKVAERCW